MKRVLMVAFHFPPFAGSSGVQRTLRFAQYLPDFGWQPIVLAPHRRAYEKTDDSLLAALPPGLIVARAFCADAARHLALRGRYPGWLARPDRWTSWWLGGVPLGMSLIRRYRPDAIWSTYPIATAHRIGGTLQRLSGLPWVADFRDPMAQPGYPRDRATWRSFARTERVALRAACWTFTTPGAVRFYQQRYPELGSAERTLLIENGYDEESFAGLPSAEPAARPQDGPITLLHSGVVYPEERDPTQLMAALRLLADRASAAAARLRIRFRAATHDALIADLAARHGVAHLVEFAPPIPYREALAEMASADALLVMQAASCNDQIPAKIYEYLRAGRPIVALTDEAGDTAGVMRKAQLPYLAPLDSAPRIAQLLERVAHDLAAGQARPPALDHARRFSRKEQTRRLAQLLDRVSETVQ